MDPQDPAGPTAVRLGAVLDLNAAAPLAAELLAARGLDVEVDASEVARMGAQCLQVLLSARATWGEDGASFAIVQPSLEFSTALDVLGASLDTHFQASEIST